MKRVIQTKKVSKSSNKRLYPLIRTNKWIYCMSWFKKKGGSSFVRSFNVSVAGELESRGDAKSFGFSFFVCLTAIFIAISLFVLLLFLCLGFRNVFCFCFQWYLFLLRSVHSSYLHLKVFGKEDSKKRVIQTGKRSESRKKVE